MSQESLIQAGAPDPRAVEQVMQISLGYMPAICLNLAVKLGVPDQLADGPRAVEDIAAAVGADPDALHRVLRALASVGVFQETAPRRFAHTAASALLLDQPGSMRDGVLWIADPLHFRCYANLMHSLRTGETVTEVTLGQPIFEYFRTDPEESAVFNGAMVGLTRMIIPTVLEAYDFTGIRRLVDVGGGAGSVVAAILERHPAMRGVLMDVDHVVAAAGPVLEAAGVADRCEVVAGDFFQSVPAGGDAYILKQVIHDWDDARCLTILGHIRAALAGNPEGRLLLLEAVMAPGNEPHLAKWIDIEMLALAGGRERTEDEFRKLLADGGFILTRIVPTTSPIAVIEARLES